MNISQSECAFQSTNMDVQKYQKSVLGKSCKPCSSRLKELKRQSVKVMMIEYNKMMLGNGVPCVSTLGTSHPGAFYKKMFYEILQNVEIFKISRLQRSYFSCEFCKIA